MPVSRAAARRQLLRALFTDMITAYGRKDFDAFAEYLTEETVFEWPYLPLKEFPDKMVGAANFIAASREGMANSNPYNHQVDQFYDLADPDMLIVEYHSDTTFIDSGNRYANKYLGILRFKGEKVVYWKEYINPLPVLEAYGADFVNQSASGENN